MPDVASDPSTHKAYVTSQGDDSLYVADSTSRVAAIQVGPAPHLAGTPAWLMPKLPIFHVRA